MVVVLHNIITCDVILWNGVLVMIGYNWLYIKFKD
jgi:hypothetical protein